MITAIISLSIPSYVEGVDGDYVRGIVWGCSSKVEQMIKIYHIRVVGRVDDGNRLLIYLAKATTWVRIPHCPLIWHRKKFVIVKNMEILSLLCIKLEKIARDGEV